MEKPHILVIESVNGKGKLNGDFMTEGNEIRTLARGDSQIIGGVCSGIAE